MHTLTDKLEALLDWGGIRKDITLLVISAAALAASIFHLLPLPFDPAWVAIILCGIPIILEAIIGLVTAFDIKADVLVSLALIASVAIGEEFAAGEVAFIMQLGALLEDLTVAKARAGIEKLVRLTPRTARVLTAEGERIVPAEEVQVGDRLRVAARRDHPGGRRHSVGPDLHQSGGDDRRVPAGGQGARGTRSPAAPSTSLAPLIWRPPGWGRTAPSSA